MRKISGHSLRSLGLGCIQLLVIYLIWKNSVRNLFPARCVLCFWLIKKSSLSKGGDYDILDYDSFLKQLQSKYGDIVKFVTPFAKMVRTRQTLIIQERPIFGFPRKAVWIISKSRMDFRPSIFFQWNITLNVLNDVN